MKRKTTIYKATEQTKEVKEDIVCDWCGDEFKLYELDKISSFVIKWNSDSYYNGLSFSFDICQNCFEKHLKDKSRDIPEN